VVLQDAIIGKKRRQMKTRARDTDNIAITFVDDENIEFKGVFT